MNIIKIKLFYLAWHYTRAVKDYLNFLKTALWFVWNFFSIKNSFITFFHPFKKLRERYRGGFNLANFFESLVITNLMRLVGMFLRSILIFVGLVTWFGFLIFGLIGIVIWIFLPFILIFIFISGLLTFFKT
jgi:hypothetical protein